MIVFLSNFLNHHQYPVADELYRLTAGKYRFIEMNKMDNSFKTGGFAEYPDLPWLIRAWESPAQMNLAQNTFIEATIAVYGANYPYDWVRQRLEQDKLTFEYGERWMKRGLVNILSPRLIKNQWHYHLHFSGRPIFRLNAGAYAAKDMKLLHSFRDKQLKWGYFTHVPELDIRSLHECRGNSRIRIMWCARFIKLKHPEMAIRLAQNLKKNGFCFSLEMYGTGPLRKNMMTLAEKCDLDEYISFPGNISNSGILQKMEQADIFLFTSDRHEGWGAVVNEAMSRGCAVVTSDSPGCVPWLIEPGLSGVVFRDGSQKDLNDKTAALLAAPTRIREIGTSAYIRMRDNWSPSVAARRFLELSSNILDRGNIDLYQEGVCSKA